MWRRRIWQPVGCLLMVCLLLAVSVSTSLAAKPNITKNPGGNGLRVSPVRSDLVINPGKSQTVNVNVTNVTANPASLQAIINDFTANRDESGNPAIILDPNQYASSHSLKRYVAPIPQFTLAPGQSKSIPITINIPKNAAGGGYFAAVRFAPSGTITGTNLNVSLAGSVGTLFLVKVPGDIKEQMSIASFEVNQDDRNRTVFTTNKNINAIVRFQNTGNVQVQPFGKVTLKNRSGKELFTTEINKIDPPANVLPDSIRKFPVPLKNVGSFGKFKVDGNFGYGSNGQLLSASTTFYVIPLSYIYGFIFLVALILFLIFALPRMIKSYNNRVVRRAGRR